MPNLRLNRRSLLASVGAGASALFLPSLLGRTRAASGATPAVPQRLIIIHTGHGTVYDNWKIRAGASGNDASTADWQSSLDLAQTDFSPILRPLWAHRQKMLVVDGLAMHTAYTDMADANGHQTGGLTSLTGSWRTSDNNTSGPSIDQVIGAANYNPSGYKTLNLSFAGGSEEAYNGVIRDAGGKPLIAESDLAAVFQRLFANLPDSASPAPTGPTDAQKLSLARSAAIDLLVGEYGSLATRLSGDDRNKLQSHQALLTDLKARFGAMGGTTAPLTCTKPTTAPTSGGDTKASWAAQAQLAVLALQCDLTRTVTIESGGPSLEDLGYGTGNFHNDYAHHADDGYPNKGFGVQGSPVPMARQVATDYHAFNASLVSSLCDLLDQTPESDGTTLLDNTMVVWCGELGSGGHDYATWPATIIGGSGAGLKLGRNLFFGQGLGTTSGNGGGAAMLGPAHNRFWVTIANALGVSINQLGQSTVTRNGSNVDCTGALKGLT